jgi:uncharacterized protein YllA (UPF0747 family)
MGEAKEGAKLFLTIAIVLFLLFGLVVALNMAGLIVLPTYLSLERNVYKNSYQYTEAKQTELLSFVSDYNGLETKKQEYIATNTNGTYNKIIDNIDIQQKALADKIRNEAEKVSNQNELPKSVRQFLTDHPS